jgi:hypothetical protein
MEAVDGDERSGTRSALFVPGEIASAIHRVGGWVDSVAGLDASEKRKGYALEGVELRSLRVPARSLTAMLTMPSRLSYKSSSMTAKFLNVEPATRAVKGEKNIIDFVLWLNVHKHILFRNAAAHVCSHHSTLAGNRSGIDHIMTNLFYYVGKLMTKVGNATRM